MFRWVALAVLISTLGISAWQRSLARSRAGSIPRGRESPGLIASRLVVGLPLFGGVIAYLISPDWMAWASVGAPSWVRWLGVALGVSTIPTAYWVLAALGSNVSETVLTKEGQELVTGGPYRWVRHPLYSTGIGLFLGIALMAANAFILVWTVVALLGVRFGVVPREEAALISRFGDEYRRYRARTGALVPNRGGGPRWSADG